MDDNLLNPHAKMNKYLQFVAKKQWMQTAQQRIKAGRGRANGHKFK